MSEDVMVKHEDTLDALEILAGIGKPKMRWIPHELAKHLTDTGLAIQVGTLFKHPILQITEQGEIYLRNHRAYPLEIEHRWR